jgi:pyruvate dehydrogenase E2 component (dihydrolipoamide acetyltransferase)
LATIKEIIVPDLGNVKEAEIIEVAVKPGDNVEKEGTLITLESDKASMDIPAPFAGVVKELKVKNGDKVSTGKIILTMEVEGEAAPKIEKTTEKEKNVPSPLAGEGLDGWNKKVAVVDSSPLPNPPPPQGGREDAHAGPTVRRLAHELDVDLSRVKPTGPKGRILKEDLIAFIKGGAGGGMGLPSAPVVDFSQFGAVENKPLSRIKRLTATNLHRNWLLVPHVTQFAEADITALEDFRKAQQATAEKQGFKLTPLVFIMKEVVNSLKAFPQFNASLSANGEQLVLKKYFHIGVAVDTPEGLVVPVIRDVDKKSLLELAKELSEVSKKAREKKLSPNDMQGGCFSISSLGGIGGTAFTPIVNVPEVAILGVSKAAIKPVYQFNQFVPRLLLPLSLSYDHRVIDGAEGARFIMHLTDGLAGQRWTL